MKITFSLNQIAHVKSNDYRLYHAIDLFRSYMGIESGDRFGPSELLQLFESVRAQNGPFIIYTDEELQCECISIRGNVLYLDLIEHAARVDIAYTDIQKALNAIEDGTGNLSKYFKAVKAYKHLLDVTEW